MKKIIVSFILVCLLASVVTGCSSNSAPTFKTFTPEDASFSIDFPGDPTTQSQSMDTPSGEMKINTFMLEGKEAVYTVATTLLPEEVLNQPVDEFLMNACNGAVAQTQGTNDVIEDVTIDGYAGKYVIYDINNNGKAAKAHQKIFVAENTMYQLMVINVDDEKSKESREKFFNSFSITKK
ncbi:hypothetical protein R9X47_17825 [Wukongibacter baidiensis]|uniref:hypothetical protein n=1 Tax=Wukongibacter baidiensis TaxID=1723361 RepID=UPI003D7FB504